MLLHNRKKPSPREGSTAIIDTKARVDDGHDHTESRSQTTAQSPSSSTLFSSWSDESVETTITSVHDSFLEPKSHRSYSDAMIQRLAGQQRKDAENIQSRASFRKRAAWVAKDREAYKTSIKAITESNDLIERLVRTRALKNFDSLTTKTVSDDKATYRNGQTKSAHARKYDLPTLPTEEDSCIKSLARLHGALIQSMKSKEGKGMAKSQFGFRASLDHSLTKESLLMDFEELPFRTDSQVYLLQAVKPSEANESTFLLAESPIESSSSQSSLQAPLDDLDPFVHVGDFSAAASDIHRLYRDSTSWAAITNLQDLIGSSQKPPSPAVRYRLAALLATTHLHSTGLSYTPGQLSPENFKYFDILSEAESYVPGEMLEDEDRLLSLYYFSGIGSGRPKKSTRAIGALKGTTPTFDVATIELGLLLYQIGSWQRLEYGKVSSNAALEKLREIVKQRIHDLHREAGLRYAETVEKCLEWRHKPAKEREAELPLLYVEIIKSLKNLDEDIRLGSLNAIPSHIDDSLENPDEACTSGLSDVLADLGDL